MTKSLLISIQPQRMVNILNGLKTYEVRKVVPKWVIEKLNRGETVEAYLYCTKGKAYLFRVSNYGWQHEKPYTHTLTDSPSKVWGYGLNATIPCKVVIDGYHYITYGKLSPNEYGFVEKCDTYFPKSVDWVLKDMCLSQNELNDYVKGKDLYALHISKLEILDEAMKLNDFKTVDISQYQDSEGNPAFDDYYELKRPPVSMMSVWVK